MTLKPAANQFSKSIWYKHLSYQNLNQRRPSIKTFLPKRPKNCLKNGYGLSILHNTISEKG